MNKQYFEKDLIVNNEKIKGVKLKYVKLIPGTNKCIRYKKTGHKFIHTIKHIGLPLDIPANQIDLYEEVNI